MRFTEEYLFEATFTNPENLKRHYHQHVLQDGEKFDPMDPKYPSSMTIEEYAKEAKELSEAEAGDSENRESHIIGFQIGNGRRVKFRKRTNQFEHNPELARFCDMVMYVDDEERGTEVISYMLGRPGKIFRMKQQFVSELPENE